MKLQLSQRIRNMRHYSKTSSNGKSNAKFKAVEVASVDSAEVNDVDMENYHRNVSKIQKQWKFKNLDKKQVKILMDISFTLRSHWIQHEVKSVRAVVDTLPCLKSKTMVRVLTFYLQ